MVPEAEDEFPPPGGGGSGGHEDIPFEAAAS